MAPIKYGREWGERLKGGGGRKEKKNVKEEARIQRWGARWCNGRHTDRMTVGGQSMRQRNRKSTVLILWLSLSLLRHSQHTLFLLPLFFSRSPVASPFLFSFFSVCPLEGGYELPLTMFVSTYCSLSSFSQLVHSTHFRNVDTLFWFICSSVYDTYYLSLIRFE